MARIDTLPHFLTDVADAIREKKGTQETIQASDFDTEIENLPSGGGGLDWSAIGYSNTPESIIDEYNYAKEILNNWTPSTNLANKFAYNDTIIIMPLVDTTVTTRMDFMFDGCTYLREIPLLDTKNVTNFQQMFSSCRNLISIPLLDTSKATILNNMLSTCYKLSDETLDNILQMCINATLYTGTKTLYLLGLRSNYYPASRIQALPHYQDFLDAGWTIGY